MTRNRLKVTPVEIPIACTLEAAEAGAQLDELREIRGRIVGCSERVVPGTLRLKLIGELDELPSFVSLAQREKSCCAFFDFSFEIEIETDAMALVVHVPEEATTMLDASAAFTSSA